MSDYSVFTTIAAAISLFYWRKSIVQRDALRSAVFRIKQREEKAAKGVSPSGPSVWSIAAAALWFYCEPEDERFRKHIVQQAERGSAEFG
jgi:hypothetical protein